MAQAVVKAPRVFLCCTDRAEDQTLARNLIEVLERPPFSLQVVCPGLTEEWGHTAHESASEGLENCTAAVIIASTELFRQSPSIRSAKSCLDALFQFSSSKLLLLRRNLSVEELKRHTPLGYQRSVDANSKRLEDVARLIYDKVHQDEGMDDRQYLHLRNDFGERQSSDDQSSMREQHYLYDVFICFQNDAAVYVKETLLKELEDPTVGVKACVHYRDFRPGKTIIRNIIDCIRNSRNVVFVVSHGFSTSGWCSFEVDAAITVILKRAQGENRKVIPILLPGATVPEELQIYQPVSDGDAEFWPKLKSALKSDVSS